MATPEKWKQELLHAIWKNNLLVWRESTAHAQQIKDEQMMMVTEETNLSCPEASLTGDKKRQLIQALVNSM